MSTLLGLASLFAAGPGPTLAAFKPTRFSAIVDCLTDRWLCMNVQERVYAPSLTRQADGSSPDYVLLTVYG